MFDIQTIRARNGQATRTDPTTGAVRAVVFGRDGREIDPTKPVVKGERDALAAIRGLAPSIA